MRKYIALGLGVLTSATFMVGSSVAAQAGEPSATPTQDALCAVTDGLPTAVTDLVTQHAGAVTALAEADGALSTKQAALAAPTTDVATSLVDYVHAIDDGGDVSGALSILNVRISQYATAFAEASNAGQAWYDAQVAVLTIEQGQSLFDGIVGNLCPVPEPLP